MQKSKSVVTHELTEQKPIQRSTSLPENLKETKKEL